MNEFFLLTCLSIPDMKDLMIHTISVAVYQSKETQSTILYIPVHSQLISKKEHSQLTEDIHKLQTKFCTPKNHGSFLSVPLSPQNTPYSISSLDFRNSCCFNIQPESSSTQTKYPCQKAPTFSTFL